MELSQLKSVHWYRKSLKLSGLLPFGEFVEYLKNCHNVCRQRQVLSELSDEQLKDIGISRQQAETEAKRAFYDLPASFVRPICLSRVIANLKIFK